MSRAFVRSEETPLAVERSREAAHAVRYLALHVLNFGDSARVLHELDALTKNDCVSIDERVVLIEKWRRELWLAAKIQGGGSLKCLLEQLTAHGIVVPQRYEA